LVAEGPDASQHPDRMATTAIGEEPPVSSAIGRARAATTTVGLSSATGTSSDPSATQSVHPESNPDGDPVGLQPGALVRYFGDFELLNVLGRGGMGIVYKARQLSLNRLVALKMLQAGTSATEDDLRRFQNEAEAIAMLDHPHIVPILEVGQHEGQRYFSMKLIGGPDLGQKLGQFTTDLKAAARLVKTVAEAVHHAHQRGILHRDLKPGNVLLDERGEPHVTDFGLAKRVRVDSDLTLSGAILGTPAYMAPEQGSGNRRMVTTATDVYGLGAILYALVTGRAPFRGDSPAETLEQVRGRTPELPSKLNTRIPRDLEVVVLKCLEKEPERRYSSAAALADDLRRHLDGEPILARPTGLAIRAWMWCKRNPALWLAAALMLAVLILLIMSIGVVLVDRGRRREMGARALAEKNYTMARKALEDYFFTLTRVSRTDLFDLQDSVGMRRLRGDLLKPALGYYQEFLRERGSDPKLRRELAEAQFRVGQIMRDIGKPEEALGPFRAAITLWEGLRAAAPDDPEVRAQLARSYLGLGEQLAWIHDFPPAFSALIRSRDIFKGLEAERPSEVSYQISLAECDKELGIAEGWAGELDPGLEHLREAESILKRLLSASPGDARYRKELANTFNAQGFIYSEKGQEDEALRVCRVFQEICQSLLAENGSAPKPPQLFNALGTSYYNVASILFRRDRKGALEAFERSIEWRAALADSQPSVNDFREKLAQSLVAAAPLRFEAGRSDGAIAAIRRAIELFRALVASQSDRPQIRAELAGAWNLLGYFHDELRDNAQALPAFEAARVAEEQAVYDAPKSEPYKRSLIEILQNLGEQSADLGDVTQGLPHYRRAVQIRRELLDARPGDRVRTLDLADQLAMLATVERHGGFAADAEHSYAEAVTLLELLASAAADPALQVLWGACLMGEGRAAADQGLDGRALPLLRRAVEILTPFGSSPTGGPPARQRLTEALWETARLLRRTARPDEADWLDADRRALWKDKSPGELAALAMEETSWAATVGYGRLTVNDRVEAARRLDLDLAAENLRMAVSLGYRDSTALDKNPNASLLLSRDDVRPLLRDIAFPEDPFGTAPGSIGPDR
jgi:serine/threonine-protein kinase